MSQGQEVIGDDVWILTFYGPKCGVRIRDFPDAKKVLITFHGTPEVVEQADVFATEAECYMAAAQKKMAEGTACIQKAQEWFAKAGGPAKTRGV